MHRQTRCWKRSQEFCIWTSRQQEERVTLGLAWASETSKLIPRDTLPPIRSPPNTATPSWPSLQIYESIRPILIQITTWNILDQDYSRTHKKQKLLEHPRAIKWSRLCISESHHQATWVQVTPWLEFYWHEHHNTQHLEKFGQVSYWRRVKDQIRVLWAGLGSWRETRILLFVFHEEQREVMYSQWSH